MKTFVNIWQIIFFLNVLMLFVKFFERDDNSMKFSLWVRLIPVHFFILIVADASDSLLRREIGEWIVSLVEEGFLVVIAYSYLVYCVLRFRYQFAEENIAWFNGVFLRKVKTGEILKITFYGRKSKCHKIGITTPRREFKLRNDLAIDGMVECFGKTHGISIIRKM